MKSELRIGVIGAGFWAKYQIAAWQQLGIEVTAITNRTIARAGSLSKEMHIPTVAPTAEALAARKDVDIVDIITSEASHHPLTLAAARGGKHVICQKPMASSMSECNEMVDACRTAGVRLLIHDNWKWQTPIRSFLNWYREHPVGRAVRARISYLSSFPVFEMQPALAKAPRFILMDMGTHIVDTARAFVGDLCWVTAETATVTLGIAGEDVATIFAGNSDGHCVIELSYASPVENEHELETLIMLECTEGVMELGHDFRASVTTRNGTTESRRFPPVIHDWVIPRYALSMGSCLHANRSFIEAIASGNPNESDGDRYLNTMETIFAAYDSAENGRMVTLATGGTK